MRAKVDGDLGPAVRRRVIYVIRKPELRITNGTAFSRKCVDGCQYQDAAIYRILGDKRSMSGSTGSKPHTLLSLVTKQARLEPK